VPTTAEVAGLYNRLRTQNHDRDQRMREIKLVRQGRMDYVFPELFPTEGPFTRPIVANMVDVAARDLAEVIAPLPAFNCSSSSMVSDAARKFAEKRTRIAGYYIQYSQLQKQAYTAADRYVTYGFVPGIVEIDYEEKTPRIKWLDSMGTYVLRDRRDRVKALFQTITYHVDDLIARFPELEAVILNQIPGSATKVEVIRYHDADFDILFMPGDGGVELMRSPNPVGKCLAVEVRRPGVDDEAHGQFDDVIAVQVAKSRFALLAMEAAQKSVQAPIALPQDVQELSLGADAVLRSTTPEKIRRIPLDVPAAAFQEQGILDNELRQGSRYPEVRGGNTDASIVTGRGVQALMSGFDTQVRTAHAMFAEAYTDLIALCFEAEERLWPSFRKTIRGNDNGTPYEVSYTPEKDIRGDYSVDVQYGLMAGLDPNRALVFGLQARGDRLISQDWLRRQMPFAINASEEEQKLDIEDMRQALRQAVAGYAQAIPVLAQNGQDPGEILARLAIIIEGRQKGKPIEEVIAEAFAPPETPPDMVDPMVDDASPVPGDPMQDPMSGGESLEGIDAMGRLRGVAPGQAGLPPGGRPDLNVLLAGLTQRGEPNLAASVSRRVPTG
jgi:hypothetical protein